MIKSYLSHRRPILRTTQQLSITLPTEMAGLVRAKVASGDYATESEVIRDGLRVLIARDRAMEHWLQTQVGPAYDALKDDPSRAVPIAQVRNHLAAVNRAATSKA
jgi:antitoxin ParD1/3/4